MDNLLGFCFCFTFFYRYALKSIVYALQVFAFEQKPIDKSLTFLFNVSTAGYLGFLLINKSFLETHALLKIIPLAVLGAARFCFWPDEWFFEEGVLTIYEMAIPIVICALMMLSHRFRPHY